MLEYSGANLLTHGVVFAWIFRASIVRVRLDKLESSFTDSIFAQDALTESAMEETSAISHSP
jgi:hypothetical protein